MGQRTQIGINVKFIAGNGTEYIERGVYHYQWGGYHPGMFENLIGLFINAKNYVLKAKKDNYYMKEFERKFAYRNWLKMDFVDMLSSDKNHLVNEEIKDYDQFKDKTINTVTEKEYYNFLLNYQDCNDGRIAVDILLDGKNSYCKWNFLKDNGSGSFEEIIERDLTGNTEEITDYWCENVNDEEYKGYLKTEMEKLLSFIVEYIGEAVDEQDNEVQIIEYDKEFFQSKFNEFIKEK